MSPLEALKHIANIGRAGRIGENCLFDLLGGNAVADRETEDIDYFVDVRADEMGTKNAPTALFDQRLKAVDPLGDAAGRIPIRHLLAIDPKLESCPARFRFA